MDNKYVFDNIEFEIENNNKPNKLDIKLQYSEENKELITFYNNICKNYKQINLWFNPVKYINNNNKILIINQNLLNKFNNNKIDIDKNEVLNLLVYYQYENLYKLNKIENSILLMYNINCIPDSIIDKNCINIKLEDKYILNKKYDYIKTFISIYSKNVNKNVEYNNFPHAYLSLLYIINNLNNDGSCRMYVKSSLTKGIQDIIYILYNFFDKIIITKGFEYLYSYTTYIYGIGFKGIGREEVDKLNKLYTEIIKKDNIYNYNLNLEFIKNKDNTLIKLIEEKNKKELYYIKYFNQDIKLIKNNYKIEIFNKLYYLLKDNKYFSLNTDYIQETYIKKFINKDKNNILLIGNIYEVFYDNFKDKNINLMNNDGIQIKSFTNLINNVNVMPNNINILNVILNIKFDIILFNKIYFIKYLLVYLNLIEKKIKNECLLFIYKYNLYLIDDISINILNDYIKNKKIIYNDNLFLIIKLN